MTLSTASREDQVSAISAALAQSMLGPEAQPSIYGHIRRLQTDLAEAQKMERLTRELYDAKFPARLDFDPMADDPSESDPTYKLWARSFYKVWVIKRAIESAVWRLKEIAAWEDDNDQELGITVGP